METRPLSCIVIVSSDKELYDLETLLFKYDIHWIDYKVGRHYSLSDFLESENRYIYIDKDGELTHGSTKHGTSSQGIIYSYEDFMRKYRKTDSKSTILNDNLYKRKKIFLRQDR